MFKIGDFSRLSNTSVRMLRHYDKLELLAPSFIQEDSGYRFYEASQLETVNRIKKLQQLGFSLSIIKELLESQNPDTLSQYLSLRKKEVQEELDRIESQASMLNQVSSIMKKEMDIMNYHVVLKEIPERKVVSLRKVLPKYEQEGQLWQELAGYCTSQKIKASTPPLGISIYHDADYKEENVDVEIQSSVEGDYEDTGDIHFKVVPAVQAATVTFNGSFDQMNAVTKAIAQWIEANGYQMAGPMFNISHVSPGQDPNPENWITEACFTVEKKS